MKIYKCIKPFYCGPLDVSIPVGSMVYKYEQVEKIVLEGVPQPRKIVYTNNLQEWEIDDPEGVEWFSDKIIGLFYEFVKEVAEDNPGGGGPDLAITQYIVGDDTWYNTIYDALEAASQHGVDKPYIFLRPGTFALNGTLTISSPMILEGSGEGTIIDAQFATPSFMVLGAGVEFRSFILEGGGISPSAIVFSGANSCRVEGCRFRNINGTPILMQNMTRNTSIESNVFQGYVNYIVDESSGDFNIVANNIVVA